MGPRLVSRGEAFGGAEEGRHLRGLQWGHGLLAVERKGIFSVEEDFPELQWGHGLLAVERATVNRWRQDTDQASMGPRLVSRGEGHGQPLATGHGPGFNGATAC